MNAKIWFAAIGVATIALVAGCGTDITEPTAVGDLTTALTSAPKADNPVVVGMMNDADANVGGMMQDDDADANVGGMMGDDNSADAKTTNPASTRRSGMIGGGMMNGGMTGMMGKVDNGTNVEMDADDMPVQECLEAMKDLDEDAPQPEAVQPGNPDDDAEHGRHHPDQP